MRTAYPVKAAAPKPPTRYREQKGAEQKARWMRLQGRKAYVYQCRDCKLQATLGHRFTWRDPETGEKYSWTVPGSTINAWHCGIDTGADHHVNRTTHFIPTYTWDDSIQDWAAA